MGTGRPSSSGATGGLNASASAFVFAPRRCPAAVDVVVERAMPVPVDELASLGLVSEEDADAHVDGVEELEREGVGGGRSCNCTVFIGTVVLCLLARCSVVCLS